jgi:hypothetical protein
LRQPGFHAEPFGGLKEERERGNENGGPDRKSPPAQKAGEDHR